jgi:hypothetical protein
VFTLPATRETARVEAFVAAIRRSADCVDACHSVPLEVESTVELPRIVATTAASEPAVLESHDRRTFLALAAMLVALVACLTGGLMHASAAPAQPVEPVVSVVDLTTERAVELGGMRAASGGAA